MSVLENSIQEYVDQISNLKREITILKENERKTLHMLNETEKSRQEYIKKATDSKYENKSLKNNLKQVKFFRLFI